MVLAATTAMVRFYTRYGSRLTAEELDPITDTWSDHQGLETRITYPYCTGLFGLPYPRWPEPAGWPLPPLSGARVGRNAPCPCGSQKKYKKCCMSKGYATPSS